MATFGEVRTLVLTGIARDDAVAILVANAAINYAVAMASLTFEPPEMSEEVNVTLTGGDSRIVITSLTGAIATHLLDIIRIYNNTEALKLGFISYDVWDSIVPVLTSVRFWSIFGQTLLFKGTPTANKSLTISYTRYPALLTNADTPIPFSHHDQYIVATATGICWAVFEEADNASMWSQIASFLGDPSALGAKARAVIEGQRILLEKAIGQARGGN
ncbi:MAG: hypothetical protein WC097_00690 [Eubacteriales bacterium]